MIALVVLFIGVEPVHGQVTWRRTYGGFGSDQAASVRQTADGGYVICGTTGSFGNGSGDIYVVRTDEFGEPLWSRTYGDIGVDQGIACRELVDGYVIAGSTSIGEYGGYDMVLIRTDLNGDPLWERQFGSPDWDICNAFDVMTDGFLMGGISYGGGYTAGAAYMVKTDFNGDTLWTQSWGGALLTECKGISSTMDEGFVITGRVATSSGSDDGFVRKYDQNGNEEWTTFSGGDSADYFSSVVETPAGKFVANGATKSFQTFQQIYLVGFSDTGQMEWERQIGILADAGGTEVRNNNIGGFVLTGFNTLNLGALDMILTVTDVEGYFLFGFNYGDGFPANGFSADPTDDGGYVVAGWCEGYGPGLRAMYVVKTDSLVLTASLDVNTYVDPLGVDHLAPIGFHGFLPNPVDRSGAIQFNIQGVPNAQLLIHDTAGRLCRMVPVVMGRNTVPLTGLAPGSYCALVVSSDRLIAHQMLIVQ